MMAIVTTISARENADRFLPPQDAGDRFMVSGESAGRCAANLSN
jgi:hypothetical protein